MIYKIGIYIRLSHSDNKDKEESESISNQRSIILNYLEKLDINYQIYQEYIDDGYSGTNFDRPSFKKLINDIEENKVNCVITKDYSRLGRDYIKTGEYLEKYFPMHNIRYIAILDDIDTYYDSTSNDIAPFKAVFNDQYAKDTSKKVRRSLRIKKEQGLFLGWKAVYGYKLDPNNRYKLVIDDNSSQIVKQIFNLAYLGYGPSQIANILTSKNIPTPSVYANLHRHSTGIWSSKTIKDILTNPTYTGSLYQGIRKKINYKIKKEIKTPKENWIITKNSHLPIIDKQIFNIVNNNLSKNKNLQSKSSNYLLKGFIKCYECQHQITISKIGNNSYTSCAYYRKYSKYKLCTPHTINYNLLEQSVLKEISKYLKSNINKVYLKEILQTSTNKKIKTALTTSLNSIKLDKNNLLSKKKQLYYDKLDNIITTQEYIEYTKEITNNINTLVDKETKLLKKINIINNQKYDYDTIIDNFINLKDINKNMLSSIINYLTIDKDKNITIYYHI